MSREKNRGVCEHCQKNFGYHLIHNGFNESSYAYCVKCGMTALLDGKKRPKGLHVEPHQGIFPDEESQLATCSCGGSFKSAASPRCPHCSEPLSPILAAEYIEAQAEGAKHGWHWQQSWSGLYCIIIEDRVVQNAWKKI